MPASLRLLIGMVVTSVVIAVASIGVLIWQDRAQARGGPRAPTPPGCGGCHAISLVAGADGLVGPPLAGIATRAELAGHLANTPGNMKRWIQHPQRVAPGSGMPDVGLTDRQTRDIAAYLYTLR
jgi:cytochrome c2